MKLQVWSDWSLFSDCIQNTFLSSQKKNNTQLIICPEMGKNNAFPNNKVFVLRSGFIGMINLAFTICSPVCPQGNYHSLLILLHWKGWKDRHFQKSYQKELISIEKKKTLLFWMHVGSACRSTSCESQAVRQEPWPFVTGSCLLFEKLCLVDI